MRLIGPYHYGGTKWEDYLIEIRQTIESGNDGQTVASRVQAGAIGELRETLSHGLDSLSLGLESLSQGLDSLRAEFEWGLTLVVDRLDSQLGLLSRVAEKLDAIHLTLSTPLLTQARELFLLGQGYLQKGLLDKALEAFLKAEEKNDVDFLLQLQLGKLYLYGRDEDDNVVNLSESERHLLLAARYADAERGLLKDWNEFSAQAYFHAGVAAYLLGSQESAAGKEEAVRTCLERSLTYLRKSSSLWPQFTEGFYSLAKCYALLGRREEVLEQFKVLSDVDRRYWAKACEDHDFRPLVNDIRDVFDEAISSPGPFAQCVYTELNCALETLPWMRASGAETGSIEHDIAVARDRLATLEVDLVAVHQLAKHIRGRIEKETRQNFAAGIERQERAIRLQEGATKSLQGRISAAHTRINDLREQLKSTTGGKVGCLAMVGVVGIAAFIGIGLGTGIATVLIIAAIVLSFPLYFFVNRFFPSRAEKDIHSQIVDKEDEIRDCEIEIGTANIQLGQMRNDLNRLRSLFDSGPARN